jgi:hypothetical protein
MAKVQGFNLESFKLSGLCDRLKCCLPTSMITTADGEIHAPLGQIIRTLDGKAHIKVREVNYLDGQ